MATHFVLEVMRELENVFIFRTGRRPADVRPEFADLYCDRCAKVDEWAALQRGIPPAVRVSKPVDLAHSGDGMLIVSSSVRQAWEREFPDAFHYFPFQDNEYAVAWPQHIMAVDDDAPLDRKKHTSNRALALRESRCSQCGRPGSVTVRPELASVQESDMVVGLRAETRYVRLMLIVHNRVGEILDSIAAKGWKRGKLG